MEQPIIDPVPVELLKKELTPDLQLRTAKPAVAQAKR